MTDRSSTSIRDEIQRELDAQFQARFVTFNPDALAWLALLPAWTRPLAEACRFPSDDLGLAAFLDRASGAGFCTERAPGSTATGGSFWVPDSVREQILTRLKTDTAFGAGKLQQVANRIGHEILKVQDRVEVPPVIARWAELATHAGQADETASFLNDRVTSLVESDDTGAASAWIDTGRALASSLGGALTNSVQLGTRRLELVYRNTQNERHLASFQERPEQTATFLKLIEPDNPAWAIHYLGMGGVGKTMLLRYIMGRLAPERKIPTSRIDFDHLSPDYPVRKPGQLLVELAVDLRSYATNDDVERRFTRLRGRNDRLLEALGNAPPPQEPLANIRRPEFDELLSAFTDLLVALPRPERAPVVLILDTCEELARLPTRGNIQPGIEATFEILARAHQTVPDLRVVLAGRRLLGSSGSGWRADETKRLKTGILLPAREFMALHEIRGFDRREAIRFLTEKKKLEVRSDALEAIVDRSREAGTVAPVIVEGVSRDDDPRFNPFDLALFANWIREDSEEVVDQIVSGDTDPYVEMRIVYRLRGTAIEPLLPCIVLWQRFDKAMLECAAPGLSKADVDDLFARVADLEWIDVQQDEALGTDYLEVDHNLYSRLLAYYREPPRDRELEAAAARLATPLASLVRERIGRQDSVTFEHLNAALAASPPDVGASLWNDLMLRLTESGDWNWALNVTSRLLAEGGAVERRPQLRAAVLATLTAAELHGGTGLSLTASWQEIERAAPGYPVQAVGMWLQQRACAGRIASILRTESDVPDALLQEFWRLLDTFDPEERGSRARPWAEQLAASLCAALHGIVERCDVPDRRGRLIPDREAIERFAARLNAAGYPGDLSAFVRTLAAEVRHLDGVAGESGFGLDDGMPNDPQPQRWMDWRQPDAFGDHLRLRLWRVRPPTYQQLQTNGLSAFRVKESLRTIASIESERFLSLLVQLHLAHGPGVGFEVPLGPRQTKAHTLDDLQEADEKAYSPARQSTCRAHEAISPLFVSLGRAYLALGDVPRALSIVNDRLKIAEASRRDPATVRHAEIARLKISRRTRTPLPGSHGRIEQSHDAALVGETLALTALAGPDLSQSSAPPSLGPGDYALAHAWWSTQSALSPGARQRLVQQSNDFFSTVLQSEAEKALPVELVSAVRLDGRELRLLMTSPGVSSPERLVPIWRTPPEDTSTRTILRDAALGANLHLLDVTRFDGDGRRHVAATAFEEGELLRLRLPAQAADLLRLAAALYEKANDPLGAWMSSIAAAMAFWHAGNVSEVRKTLETITKPAHARLIAGEPGRPSLPLPPWEEWEHNPPEDVAAERRAALLKNPKATGAEILRELLGEEHVGDPVPWTGWRMRLALCRRLSLFENVTAAEKALSGLVARLPRELPAELQAFPDRQETPETETPQVKPTDQPKKADPEMRALAFGWIGLLLIFLYFVFTGRLTPGPTSVFNNPPPVLFWPVLAVIGGVAVWTIVTMAGASHGAPMSWLFGIGMLVLFAGYWLVGWIAGFIIPWPVTPVVHFGAFLALVVGIPLAQPVTRRAKRWLTSQLAARGRLEVAIGLSTLYITGHRLALRGTGTERVEISVNVPRPGPAVEPYLESAKRLPKEAQAQLHDFRVALGSRPLIVDAVIPAGDLAAIPWEAVLSLTSLDSRIEKDPLRFRRVLTGGSTPSKLREMSPPVRTTTFFGSKAWFSMAQKAWAKSGAADVQPSASPIGEASAFLHVVGEPVTTGRGVSISTGASRYESNLGDSIRQDVNPAFNMPDLVSADDRFVRAAVAVIVQMEPSDSLTRLATDREQAGHLRTFAASLVSQGVERVITVPALPAGLGEAVLDALTPAVVDPDRHRPTDAIARARARILAWPAFSEEDGRTHDESLIEALKELAYDVCLFVRLDQTTTRSKGDK